MNRGRGGGVGGRTTNECNFSARGRRGRGRGQPPAQIYVPVVRKDSSSTKDGLPQPGHQKIWKKAEGSMPRQGSDSPPSNCSYNQDCSLGGAQDKSSDISKLKLVEDSQGTMISNPLQLNSSHIPVAEHVDTSHYKLKNTNQNSFKTLKAQPLKLVEDSNGTVTNSPVQPNCFPASVSKPVEHAREVTSHTKLKGRDHTSWITPKSQPLTLPTRNNSSLQFGLSPASTNSSKQEYSVPAEADTTSRSLEKADQCEDAGGSENSDGQSIRDSFDICLVRSESKTNLIAPLYQQNRAKRNEIKRSTEGGSIKELRSGMLLLKGYLSLDEQVQVVKRCRDFGRGPGGFYEPGYREGGKLHLKMMCLGKNWDPQTSKYGDKRPSDDAKPPLIPDDFLQLVKRTIQESHLYLKGRSKSCNAEYVLPSMNPNICIVNFYTESGRLGLHQDKDESLESLRRGLPVVSVSIGNSAEFLYGDERDVDRAEKVVLESGDVLIFGGKSRHVFHGVSTIFPNSAPRALMTETNMRTGRLNLTFREY